MSNDCKDTLQLSVGHRSCNL